MPRIPARSSLPVLSKSSPIPKPSTSNDVTDPLPSPARQHLLLLGSGLALLQPAAAQHDTTYLADLPPLLDRELFFGDPEISGAQLSPDGQYLSFIKPYKDVRNIWVKGIDEPFDAARPVTADTTRPVPGYFWSQDSQHILYVQDKGGNENYHIYVVDPAAQPDAGTGVPAAHNITDYEDTRARILAVPENTPGEIIVGLNDRDAAWHDVYRIDLETGARTLLLENTEDLAGYTVDLEGNLRLATRTTQDGSTEILRVDGDQLTPVYTCSVEETCSPIRFHKDGERVYMETNRGDDVDLTRLVLMDAETGATELVESDPENEVDFGGAEFSDKTDELVATYYLGDRMRIYPKDPQVEQDLQRLREQLPEGEIYFGSSTEDETKHLITVGQDVDPGSVYLYDRGTGQAELLYRSRPELPSAHLAPMKAIRYQARDGMTIPAYLTLPKGAEATNLPAIILPHGGPWARDTWGYDAIAQFLANRGYAVLQPNFRGSAGYGKAFLNAGNAKWGEAMQDDLTDGAQYLIDEGIADPERVGIMGGSYGGYATLAGLTFTPERYAAGVSIVGPSNLITLLQSIPPYWASIRRIFNVRMGDLDDPEDRERLKQQSPFFSADQIQAPLLVIQGANDPRVKQAESDQIVVAARENDVDVAYLVAPDEGHGFRGRENRLAMFAAIEAFLAQHLNGRYQQEMPDNIAQRLEELTVDVNTVTLPEAPEGSAEAETAPLPKTNSGALEPVTLQYTSTTQTQGQSHEVSVTRTVEPAEHDGQAVWRVIDQAQTPMGAAADTFLLDRETLQPLQRRSTMGTAHIDLQYSSDAVTGEMQMQGQTTPVHTQLDAPVFAEGGALELTLATLPLEPGYETTFRIFSLHAQQVRPMKLAVTSTDTAQLDGQTVDTYTVELQPLDGNEGGTSTLQVLQSAPHYVVKSTSKLPSQMGGGTSTAVLDAMDADGTN